MRLSHCDTCGQCTHPKKHGTGLINKLALHVGLQDRQQQQGLGNLEMWGSGDYPKEHGTGRKAAQAALMSRLALHVGLQQRQQQEEGRRQYGWV